MNPLTLVKRLQKIVSKEASLGISENASWHAEYRESPYVFVGGVPFDLTEGDLLAVFAQYGEIVDVNLVRDKGTGKSKGFAFVAYADQRSTNLAVDNLNGASVLGRIVRVDHVSKYKKKEEEDEEEWQRKREERGVCFAFQRGECTRGDGCTFSHNKQRCANTGWGKKGRDRIWKLDGDDVSSKRYRTSGKISDPVPDNQNHERNKRIARVEDNVEGGKTYLERSDRLKESSGGHSERYKGEANIKDRDIQEAEKIEKQYKKRPIHSDDHELSRDMRPVGTDLEQNPKEDCHREKRSRRHDFQTVQIKDCDRRMVMKDGIGKKDQGMTNFTRWEMKCLV